MTAKVEDYYGFVIRRLAASGSLPAGLPGADPSGAAAPGQASPRSVRAAPCRGGLPPSASVSRQTQAE